MYVDALHDDFDGTVESMPAVTGSRTSVLPPENATGNYVKVIQRLPVRIRFNAGQKDMDKLRPGMSVGPEGASGLAHGSSLRNRASRRPAIDQSMDHRHHRYSGDVHGGARLLDRQRRTAAHRRHARREFRKRAPG